MQTVPEQAALSSGKLRWVSRPLNPPYVLTRTSRTANRTRGNLLGSRIPYNVVPAEKEFSPRHAVLGWKAEADGGGEDDHGGAGGGEKGGGRVPSPIPD